MKRSKELRSYSFDSPNLLKIYNLTSDLYNELVDVLESYLRNKSKGINCKPLGLATGKTMIPVYDCLVNRLKKWNTDELERLRCNWCSFNIDEYVGLSSDDENSFNSYMWRHLASRLDLKKKQVHLPNSEAIDPKFEASLYSKQIDRHGGLGFVLLGLGLNGHIAFNEPPASIDSKCRLVNLSNSTIEENSRGVSVVDGGFPSRAITLGISEIIKADEIHLVATGDKKKKILKDFLDSPPSSHLPVSWLKKHQNISIWVDNNSMY